MNANYANLLSLVAPISQIQLFLLKIYILTHTHTLHYIIYYIENQQTDGRLRWFRYVID